MDLNRIIRLKELKKIIGLSASTIWRKENNNEFPKRIHLGARSVGWLEKDVQHWIKTKLSGEKHHE